MPPTSEELSLLPPAEPRHLASETHLRVVTWNVQHASPTRARTQAIWLADCEYADVAVLTEVGHGPGATALLRALGDLGFHTMGTPPAVRGYTTVIATRTPDVEAVPVPVEVLPHRIVAARVTVGGCKATVVGLYVPSRGPAERRNVDKRAFQASVTGALPRLTAEVPGLLVITGDLNVVEPGHQPHYTVFGDWEYGFYRSFADAGLIDAFRALHPHDIEHSWYGRAGTGYRFDHTFLSANHQRQLVDCRYLHSPRINGLSDHSAMATTVADVEAVRLLLEALDFKPLVTVDKRREAWLLTDVEVAFDTVEGLGSFVEFEFKGDAENEREATARLHEFIDTLGVPLGERNYGYPHMLLDCQP